MEVEPGAEQRLGGMVVDGNLPPTLKASRENVFYYTHIALNTRLKRYCFKRKRRSRKTLELISGRALAGADISVKFCVLRRGRGGGIIRNIFCASARS